MATYEPDEKKELEDFDKNLESIRQQTSDRSDRVDDLSTRFRTLRKRNNFRLMLEEIFHE